jgi:hypothetical protein
MYTTLIEYLQADLVLGLPSLEEAPAAYKAIEKVLYEDTGHCIENETCYNGRIRKQSIPHNPVYLTGEGVLDEMERKDTGFSSDHRADLCIPTVNYGMYERPMPFDVHITLTVKDLNAIVFRWINSDQMQFMQAVDIQLVNNYGLKPSRGGY